MWIKLFHPISAWVSHRGPNLQWKLFKSDINKSHRPSTLHDVIKLSPVWLFWEPSSGRYYILHVSNLLGYWKAMKNIFRFGETTLKKVLTLRSRRSYRRTLCRVSMFSSQTLFLDSAHDFFNHFLYKHRSATPGMPLRRSCTKACSRLLICRINCAETTKTQSTQLSDQIGRAVGCSQTEAEITSFFPSCL